jgi:ABC-type transporter Mla subunit MlaD
MWNEKVVYSALRHVGTAGATAATIFGVLGLLTPDQVATFTAAMKEVMDGLQQTIGGISKLVVVLGPVFAALMAGLAGSSATLTAQIKSVLANKNVELKGTLEVPPAVANSVPSPQVVPKEAS